MKKLILLLCLVVIQHTTFAQKQLRMTNLTGIPVWFINNSNRPYTKDDLLRFIAATGWEAQYASDKRWVPYIINKASDELLAQMTLEAKVACLKMEIDKQLLQENWRTYKAIYGELSQDDFHKYCLVLVLLSKIDLTGKQ